MKMNKKTILMLASLVLLFTFVIGGTLAWIVDKTDTLVNTFKYVEVTCDVQDVEGGKTVQNTGDIDAYIRAAVVVNMVDSSGNVYPESPEYTVEGKNWTLKDGFWYYNDVVSPGGYTDMLVITHSLESTDDKNVQITVVADAIQADPARAKTNAWG